MEVLLCSPDGAPFAKADVVRLSTRTVDGNIAILPGHAPLTAALAENATVRLDSGFGTVSLDVPNGVLNVADDKVVVLVHGLLQVGREVRAG